MKLLRLFFFLILFVAGVAHANTASEAPPKKVAVLLFDGADIIDFSGPYDIFINARMSVITVGVTGKTITTAGGMKVTPDFSLSDAPAADAIVIPGGDVAHVRRDTAVLDWIRQRYAHGELVMSVCNGAFTLADTGLLKGLKATTTAGNIEALRRAHADVQVVRDARVVDNGRLITTGGLSAGIDGALHLVARLQGKGEAQFTAEVMEYNWQPEGRFLPARHGFHAMHQTLDNQNLEGFGHIETLASTQGDDDHWTTVWHVKSNLDRGELAARIDRALADERKQMQMGGPYEPSPGHRWAFLDHDGKPWNETLEVQPAGGASQLYEVKLSVSRAAQGKDGDE